MSIQQSRSYKETIAYYQALRNAVYEEAKLHIGKNIIIKSIDMACVRMADNWKTLASSETRPYRSEWNWMDAYRHFQNRPNRFEVSVWAGSELCGICYGKPSRAKTKLGLNLIESTPIRPSPLGQKAFPVISLVATFYAVAIGAEEINVLDPVNEQVAEYYMRNGFPEKTIIHGKRIALRKLL